MELYRRGDEGFEEACVGRIFNLRRPDERPEVVLLAASVPVRIVCGAPARVSTKRHGVIG